MTTTLQIGRSRQGRGRAAFSRTERFGAAAVASSLVGFAVYGFANNEPSTIGYVSVVGVLGACLAVVRRQVLPDWLVKGLVVIAIGHLCGGLIRVGESVLYNTDPGWQVLQYDHIFHASASAFGVAVLWTLASPNIHGRSLALAMSALGALGFGALNEFVEFVATLAHSGSHVGGYMNTGWDFVANTFGVLVGASLLSLRSPGKQGPTD